jgi:hypothetical protein
VTGNFIGLNAQGSAPLGNGVNGVYVAQGTNVAIGGTAPGAGNVIAFNGSAGVVTVGSRTSILSNSIYGNAGLGIDRGDNGVSLNVPCDSANEQNFPVVTRAVSGAGTTTIEGILNSRPSQSYRIEFFANAACDSSGYGQGRNYLGSTMVTTDAGCNGSFSATFPIGLSSTNRITATATSAGNTSEFSRCTTLATQFYTVAPCRIADTRNDEGPYGGPSLDPTLERLYVIAGQCGVPPTAEAVSFNFTVTQSTDPGDLRIFPGSSAPPLTSTLNYRVGQTRANNAVIALGPAGDLVVHVDQIPGGSVDLIIDVTGYFQ